MSHTEFAAPALKVHNERPAILLIMGISDFYFLRRGWLSLSVMHYAECMLCISLPPPGPPLCLATGSGDSRVWVKHSSKLFVCH